MIGHQSRGSLNSFRWFIHANNFTDDHESCVLVKHEAVIWGSTGLLRKFIQLYLVASIQALWVALTIPKHLWERVTHFLSSGENSLGDVTRQEANVHLKLIPILWMEFPLAPLIRVLLVSWLFLNESPDLLILRVSAVVHRSSLCPEIPPSATTGSLLTFFEFFVPMPPSQFISLWPPDMKGLPSSSLLDQGYWLFSKTHTIHRWITYFKTLFSV